MATLLEKGLNFIKERKAKLAANVLALGLAMTPAAVLQTQAKAAKANAAAKKEVRADKYAKYRSAENEVISQLVFHEGCARKAYKDIVGIWTVGIGNTKRPSGEKVTFRDNLINNSQVRNYVAAHLEREVYPAMNKAISRNLSNREKAAIISLCYNCGTDVLWKGGKKTALAEAINKNDKSGIIKGFMQRVSTKKHKFVESLAVRRTMELYTYFGDFKASDINSFYVGGQRGLRVDEVLKKDKTGKYTILKEDTETIRKVKIHCMTPPPAEKAPDYAWFGGNKQVSELANLGGKTYLAQTRDFAKGNEANKGRM